MRIAILHDYLYSYGGGERVLEALFRIFPQADLYTLFYDVDRMNGRFERYVKKTSFMDRAFIRKKHQTFIPLMPFFTRFLKSKSLYDLIISSSAGYAKAIPIEGKYHISYCHSPLRYAWELDDFKHSFSSSSFGNRIRHRIARALRAWDKHTSERVNLFIANSIYNREKIRAYYGRDAQVIYPPIDLKKFYCSPNDKVGDYYLMVGEFLPYKRFDIGIRAANELKIPLKIMGSGPEEKKLRSIANPKYVEFLPSLSDYDLRSLYASARALIFPQIEDFGLVAAEAQACGTPIIAFSRGGGIEIVVPGETGMFFSEQNKDSLMHVIREFETKNFNRYSIARSAEQFSEVKFREGFLSAVHQAGF